MGWTNVNRIILQGGKWLIWTDFDETIRSSNERKIPKFQAFYTTRDHNNFSMKNALKFIQISWAVKKPDTKVQKETIQWQASAVYLYGFYLAFAELLIYVVADKSIVSNATTVFFLWNVE